MSLMSNLRGHGRRGLAAVALLALLAACGGGTSQYEPFQPERMLVFGDEYSYLTPTGFPGQAWGSDGSGRKYGVNVLNPPDAASAPGAPNCESEPLWFQTVANEFGFRFAECDPTPATTDDRQGYIHASPLATVAAVRAQVDAVPESQWGSLVLATVLAGVHDIVEIYEGRGSATREALRADAGARGRELGLLVNAIVERGPRVIVSTIPDIGLAPYAAVREGDPADKAALLGDLSRAFNEQLQLAILLDGRRIGLVQADQMVQAMNRAPANFGLASASEAVCDPALLPAAGSEPAPWRPVVACTSGRAASAAVTEAPSTLLAGRTPAATSFTYLWADDLRFSWGGHYRLGLLARDRARNNPF
jgi:phospholipase/lecithinase/hemolysin